MDSCNTLGVVTRRVRRRWPVVPVRSRRPAVAEATVIHKASVGKIDKKALRVQFVP
ncbi:hypothetical protein DEU38_105248 [Rhodococcus sp. AG1013]|uniref:hypothetical protein n=1 Tax=Rhodococcus sp. AG1013 TaxID=2183996 RepID=UPI000E2A54E4|nr:hypothetical protein [Rhodococcus sp. AG1013]RDI30663.1 hypothetical protein DEU38_105248 [Rhodococcus sp. AG1013]